MRVPHQGIADNVTVYPGVTLGENVVIFPGAVIGREPLTAGSVKNKPEVKHDTIIEDGAVIGANAVIYAGVHIGKEALIGDGATIRENCSIGSKSIVGNNCTLQNDVQMGERSRIVDLSHITAGVLIGDDVFISTGVLTMNDNSMNKGGQLDPPAFFDGAMVGGGAIILPGVDVKRGALVAAGAVVTRHVDEGVRVQGVPAKPYEQPLADRADKVERDLWAQYFFEYSQQ